MVDNKSYERPFFDQWSLQEKKSSIENVKKKYNLYKHTRWIVVEKDIDPFGDEWCTPSNFLSVHSFASYAFFRFFLTSWAIDISCAIPLWRWHFFSSSPHHHFTFPRSLPSHSSSSSSFVFFLNAMLAYRVSFSLLCMGIVIIAVGKQ